jgi:hypothetical protein
MEQYGMKALLILIPMSVLLGCVGGSHNLITSTLDPVVETDVEGEYIIQARDLTPIVSSAKKAEENALKGGQDHCQKLGKEFKKKFVTSTPSAPQKWADATLHFRCIDSEKSDA